MHKATPVLNSVAGDEVYLIAEKFLFYWLFHVLFALTWQLNWLQFYMWLDKLHLHSKGSECSVSYSSYYYFCSSHFFIIFIAVIVYTINF